MKTAQTADKNKSFGAFVARQMYMLHLRVSFGCRMNTCKRIADDMEDLIKVLQTTNKS